MNPSKLLKGNGVTHDEGFLICASPIIHYKTKMLLAIGNARFIIFVLRRPYPNEAQKPPFYLKRRFLCYVLLTDFVLELL